MNADATIMNACVTIMNAHVIIMKAHATIMNAHATIMEARGRVMGRASAEPRQAPDPSPKERGKCGGCGLCVFPRVVIQG